jgi:hypothetical protein
MNRKRTLTAPGAAFVATALLAGAGCEENVTYSYFVMQVKVADSAPRSFLDRIAICGVTVVDSAGNVVDQDSMNCARCSVKTHNVGTFDWSTNRKGGNVKFIVTVNALANNPDKVLGRGMSDELGIAPMTSKTITIVEDPDWMSIGDQSGPCPD